MTATTSSTDPSRRQDKLKSEDMARTWRFSVKCPNLGVDEVMCVTGSEAALGQWQPSGLIRMERSSKMVGNEEIWVRELELPLGCEVQYRYCICLFVPNNEGQLRTVIKRWETDLQPRKVGCHVPSNISPVGPDQQPDLFGCITSGQPIIQTGWLYQETLVELKLFENAVQIWRRKHKDKDFYVKVTPVDVKLANQSMSVDVEELSESSVDLIESRSKVKSWPIINVASLEDDPCVFRPQKQFGILFKDSHFVAFQAQVFDLSTVAFLVDIYARPKNANPASEDPPEHIGCCYVLPNHFKSTEGRVEMSVVSRSFAPIGQFTCAYIIVKPLKLFECDLSKSFARHWRHDWRGLDVGHRGLGDSFTKAQTCSNIRENTIASLKDAASHGADMVEFDVQLSKDFVPVIYHDYELVTPILKKSLANSQGGGASMMVQMPVKSLTLEQLHNLKIHHVGELTELGLKTFDEQRNKDDEDEHEPFPTLEKALKVIDHNIGFNIEIKWDMELMDGSRESHNAFEMNAFVDCILKTVLEKAEDRKVFFCTFNPDICTVIRAKQNRFPVLLLTQGLNSKYDNYRDPRTWSIVNASKFVEMNEMLGISVIAENLIREPGKVQEVKAKNQVVFSWTDDMNDKDTVGRLKAMGVDAIIYDRIDMNNSKVVKQSVFLADNEQKKVTTTTSVAAPGSPHSTCSCTSSIKSDGAEGQDPQDANNGTTQMEQEMLIHLEPSEASKPLAMSLS